MKVLLLYQFEHRRQLIDTLVFYLNKYSIESDSFNIVNWQFQGKPKHKLPVALRILKPLIRIPKIRGILLLLFQRKIIIAIAKNYQVIDIHFFSASYDKIIPRLSDQNKKIKITLWGSDFYGAEKERIEKQRTLFGLVGCIQVATPQMCIDLLDKFPEYNSKIKFAHFGIQQFEYINKFSVPEELHKYRYDFRIPEKKVTIACGYNGSWSQQHSSIIDSISGLLPEFKESVFLILHMSYGSTLKYRNEIADLLEKTGVSYKLIDKSLTEEEVAKLRLITDIAINISISDAYSASIQEHIFAGSIVIAGNWLPYNFMKDEGIYFIETDLNDLTEEISDCIKNLENHKCRTVGNNEKIYNLSSWDKSIKAWCEIFKELI
jgi:glycosyltransferase involved in cell wall biosynthesis